MEEEEEEEHEDVRISAFFSSLPRPRATTGSLVLSSVRSSRFRRSRSETRSHGRPRRRHAAGCGRSRGTDPARMAYIAYRPYR